MFKNILSKVGWEKLPGYTIEKLPDGENSIPGNPLWELSNGKNKTGEPVTVFYASKKSLNSGQLDCARGAGSLKTMRHPLLLKCHDFVDNESGIYVVTERVKPLGHGENPHVWGIFQVVRALQFLHKDGKSHGVVDLSSIFVTKSGDYRLGGFELCGDLNRSAANIVRQRQILSLGILDFNQPDGSTRELDYHGVEQLIKRTFSPIPVSLKPLLARRQSHVNFIDQLVQNACFTDNAEVKTMGFLEELHIKDEGEKERFFELLPSVCDQLGRDLRRNQLLAHLVKVVEFANITASVLVSILKIAPECSEEDNAEIIVPLVTKYFSSSDRTVRFRLLVSAPDYMDRVEDALVNDKIFPQLASGFTDSVPAIREATVKALIQVVPKLKEKTRDNKVFPAMLKLLRDPEAAIRTNTVLCFGKLSQYLDGKSKILVQAYSTALKDPFPACRGSALQAINATLEQYTLEDLSETLLPFICHRLADPEPTVSSAAFEVVPKVVERIRPLVAAKHQELKEKQELEVQQQQQQQQRQSDATGGAGWGAAAGAAGWGATAGAAGWGAGWSAMTQVASTIGGTISKQPSAQATPCDTPPHTPPIYTPAPSPPPPPGRPTAVTSPMAVKYPVGNDFYEGWDDGGDDWGVDDIDFGDATVAPSPKLEPPAPAQSKPSRGMSLKTNSPPASKGSSGMMLGSMKLEDDFDFDSAFAAPVSQKASLNTDDIFASMRPGTLGRGPSSSSSTPAKPPILPQKASPLALNKPSITPTWPSAAPAQAPVPTKPPTSSTAPARTLPSAATQAQQSAKATAKAAPVAAQLSSMDDDFWNQF